jgi:hypothetical protein
VRVCGGEVLVNAESCSFGPRLEIPPRSPAALREKDGKVPDPCFAIVSGYASERKHVSEEGLIDKKKKMSNTICPATAQWRGTAPYMQALSRPPFGLEYLSATRLTFVGLESLFQVSLKWDNGKRRSDKQECIY